MVGGWGWQSVLDDLHKKSDRPVGPLGPDHERLIPNGDDAAKDSTWQVWRPSSTRSCVYPKLSGLASARKKHSVHYCKRPRDQ